MFRKLTSLHTTSFHTVLVLIALFVLIPIRFALASNYGDGNYGNNPYSSDNPSSTFAPPGPASAPTCNDTIPKSAPSLVMGVALSGTQIKLTYTYAQDPVTYYALEYGTKSGNYPFSATNIGNRDATTYTVGSLSANTIYYFRVRAGNGCMPGAWSQELSVKTKSAVSTNVLLFTDTTMETVPNEKAPVTLTPAKNKGKVVSTPTPTPTGYDVSVEVTNTKNEPVSGAKVTIHSEQHEATSDQDGIAHFTNIGKGQHQLFIAYENYTGEQSLFLDGDVKEYKLTVTVQEVRNSNSYLPYAGSLVGILAAIILTYLCTKRIFRKRVLHSS